MELSSPINKSYPLTMRNNKSGYSESPLLFSRKGVNQNYSDRIENNKYY